LARRLFRTLKNLRPGFNLFDYLSTVVRRSNFHCPCKISSTEKYDLFIFSNSPWDGLLQHPRQTARQFAQAGHRVFCVSRRFTADSSVDVRHIESSIFDLSLSGEPGDNSDQKRPSPDILRKMSDSLREFCLDNYCSTGVLLLESPFWTALAEEMRLHFGWPIIHDGINAHAVYERFSSAVASAFPKVSVIIAMHNNIRLNKLCLSSILRKTDYPNYEIIVVDNASTDGSREFALELSNKDNRVKVVLNRENESFAKANNRGLDSCSGDYVVFLNNDTIVTRGWITRLLRHLNNDPGIGIIGPVSNAVGNEAKIDVSYKSPVGIDDFARPYCREHDGETFEIPMLALFCAMIKRTLLETVGRLDERYDVGMFEDDDLSMCIKKAGYRIVCARDVFIHHFQLGTFKLLAPGAYKRIFETNRERFEDKWGQWKPHQICNVPQNPPSLTSDAAIDMKRAG
jgi:GT2 family glycosyltransferase